MYIPHHTHTLKIGLTGGIGSGKTTVGRIFEMLGIPVYYADDAAKKIMNENSEVRQNIVLNFGEDTYTENSLNRALLSSRVFNKPELLSLLNSIVHPATIKDANDWMLKQTTPYVVKEAALIFEAGSYKYLDYVIGVRAPTKLRLRRTMERDQTSEEAVQSRISRQMDEGKKLERCDFIVTNDETTLLIPQILNLHETLLSLADKGTPGINPGH